MIEVDGSKEGAANIHDGGERFPTIHVISDSIGVTAQALARAASAQFGVMDPVIEVLSKVKTADEARTFLEEQTRINIELYGDARILLFYTLVDDKMRLALQDYLAEHKNVVAVDLMTEAVDALSQVSGRVPSREPGMQRAVNEAYFRRIEAMEFAINHDDGRNAQDLSQADIVLLGVSRSSKTPVSIYLAQMGLKVANIPLDLETTPPKEIFSIDRTRIFGLTTSAQVLASIRMERLGKRLSNAAPRYAELDYIYEDLDSARALMRQLGCIVINTEGRGIEEVAQEILHYYEKNHPFSLVPM